MGAGKRDVRLVAEVRAGDAEAVRALLAAGADPNAVDETGLPVLCAAVATFDASVAEALVDGGADPDRPLPDGTTALLRAVELGSPALLWAVLGPEPRSRLPEAARGGLLTMARNWYDTGVAEELRRRTGARGPAETVRVQDDEYNHVDQVSLGGLTVRAGHGAVLTSLERAFRVPAPAEELVARALRQPDENHVDYSAARFALARRSDDRTWSALAALRRHPDPAHRLFAARVLWSCDPLLDEVHPYGRRRGELCAAWALEEPDDEVLAEVLDTFGNCEHPDMEAVGLRHAAHRDPRVRRQVPDLLCAEGVPLISEGEDALLTLAHDPDPLVRAAVHTVCRGMPGLTSRMSRELVAATRDPHVTVRSVAAETLAASSDHSPVATAALWALLDEEHQLIRLEAAYGLARRDDPRTGEAFDRVGPLGPGFEHDHRLHALRERRWHEEEAARKGTGAP
ncbi:ankyrin repeat domain-containing protein [Streptomyces pini]|uniref:Uncharacterized protein n=1 Tax=Streptomyces pini TaxID=1520580 RepID=A0A1I3XWB0_9ACTN|nr:ankyrin repeat domain-containing protein [Streptomyces pini]SFK23824.1 hypothetical protein SAMN05192584_104353 [Streptomyces pini]